VLEHLLPHFFVGLRLASETGRLIKLSIVIFNLLGNSLEGKFLGIVTLEQT
jgi:hypothetical protein